MLTQREYDIAQIESESEIKKLVQEWFLDYLGSRVNGVQNAGGNSPEGAQGVGPEGAGAPTNENVQAY